MNTTKNKSKLELRRLEDRDRKRKARQPKKDEKAIRNLKRIIRLAISQDHQGLIEYDVKNEKGEVIRRTVKYEPNFETLLNKLFSSNVLPYWLSKISYDKQDKLILDLFNRGPISRQTSILDVLHKVYCEKFRVVGQIMEQPDGSGYTDLPTIVNFLLNPGGISWIYDKNLPSNMVKDLIRKDEKLTKDFMKYSNELADSELFTLHILLDSLENHSRFKIHNEVIRKSLYTSPKYPPKRNGKLKRIYEYLRVYTILDDNLQITKFGKLLLKIKENRKIKNSIY